MSDIQEKVEEVIIASSEAASATAEAVIESAQIQIEAAQETAEKIAQAAIETSLGDKIINVEKYTMENFEKWQIEFQSLRSQITQIMSQTAELTQQTTALLALKAAETPAPNLLTPLQSPIAETPDLTLTEVLPEALKPLENAGAKKEAQIQGRVKRFL